MYANIIKKHLLILFLFLSIWTTYLVLGVSCPIYLLTGIPCPTCGVTRALLSLLHFDFEGYLYYNAFALPLVLVVLLVFHIRFINNRALRIIVWITIFIILLFNTIYYLERLANRPSFLTT